MRKHNIRTNCTITAKAVLSLGLSLGARGAMAISGFGPAGRLGMDFWEFGSKSFASFPSDPIPYRGTKLCFSMIASQTGHPWSFVWKCSQLYRQGQQYRWPHCVTIGSLANCQQMLQSNKLLGLSLSVLFFWTRAGLTLNIHIQLGIPPSSCTSC